MKIIISHKLKKIIDSLVGLNHREFTMFGKTRVEGQEVHLIDIRIPEQTSSTGATEVSPNELDLFLTELLSEGEDPEHWNMWIHSHNTMGAFWSATDKAQMQSFDVGPSHFFHVVASTKGYKGAFSSYKPFKFENEDVPVVFGQDIEDPRIQEIQNQLNAMYLESEVLMKRMAGLEEGIFADEIAVYQAQIEAKNKIEVFKPKTFQYQYTAAKKRVEKHPAICLCEDCTLVQDYEWENREKAGLLDSPSNWQYD